MDDPKCTPTRKSTGEPIVQFSRKTVVSVGVVFALVLAAWTLGGEFQTVRGAIASNQQWLIRHEETLAKLGVQVDAIAAGIIRLEARAGTLPAEVVP